MSIIKIKTRLQKKIIGRVLIKIYHYCIAVPMAYYYNLKFLLATHNFKKIHFIKDFDLLDNLTNNRISLCRFGDGEISWIYKESKGYFGQENSEELSKRLKEVLLSEKPNIIIGVPKFFDDMKEYDKSRIRSRNIHLSKYGNRWMSLLKENREYADALITRVYLGRNCDHKYMFQKWKQVWNNKNVIIVEGENTRFGVGNDLLCNAFSVQRIIVPNENAFASYASIRNEVMKHSANALYLLAIGPTATILAYDMGISGFQAIDIGHLDIEYEWYLRNAKKKVAIKGKYVNEAGGCYFNDIPKEYRNNSYETSIIAKVL